MRAKEKQLRKPKSVLSNLTEQKIDTRKEMAKIAGVSQGTIHKIEVDYSIKYQDYTKVE